MFVNINLYTVKFNKEFFYMLLNSIKYNNNNNNKIL